MWRTWGEIVPFSITVSKCVWIMRKIVASGLQFFKCVQITNCVWFWPEDVEDKKTSKSLVLSPMEVLRKNVTIKCTTGKICSWGPIKQFDDCERSSLTFVLSGFPLDCSLSVLWSCQDDLQLHSCNDCHKGFVLHYMAREVNVIIHQL
jgi:hypothetical protein